MKSLPTIDWDSLILAFGNSFDEYRHYFDLETGQVLMVMDETARQVEALYDEYAPEDVDGTGVVFDLAAVLPETDILEAEYQLLLEANHVETHYGSRVIAVPQVESHRAYRTMEDFIDTVKDKRLRNQLTRAIGGRGAFRRFKDVLVGYPSERERWFAFEHNWQVKVLAEWLEFEGVDPGELPLRAS